MQFNKCRSLPVSSVHAVHEKSATHSRVCYVAMAGVNMRLEAGAIRELHWHQTAEVSRTGPNRDTGIEADCNL